MTSARPWGIGLLVAAAACLAAWLVLGIAVPALGGPQPDELLHDFTGGTVRLFFPFLAVVLAAEGLLLLVRRPPEATTPDRVAVLLQAAAGVLLVVGVVADAAVGIRAFTTAYWGAIAIWLAVVGLSVVAVILLLVGTLRSFARRRRPATP